jgi:hypothetical protein
MRNDPSNLVVCLNQAYHWLLHARQRVMDAGGMAGLLPVASAQTRGGAARGYGKWTEQRKLQQQIRRAAEEDRPHASHN